MATGPESPSGKIEPPDQPCRCKSMEQPPRMAYSFKYPKKEFIECFESNYPQIQQCMSTLRNVLKTFEENFRCAATGSNHGKNSKIAGGVMMGVGMALAPFTLGASAVLGGAGAAVVTGGAIGSRVWNSKKSNLLTKFREEIEAELNEFQNKILLMTGKLKDINQPIEEILTDIKDPRLEVSYLDKYFASAYELFHFIQIYEHGGLAVQISETVHLTGTLTEIVAQVKSVLEKILNSNDPKEFSDMWNKINQLQEIMYKIKNIKDRIDGIMLT
ncbi:uncharacterized protein LOC125274113 [Megalobrama amblycephala]|uniref:uncharacterized protein LOC125274113 n=1 Tax=Megalobrama amblycephala TaxID=75352 RepID=UPI0020140CEC|nr:uncharacterized protein LOC125274113 [Megalobrama amblycephala]